MVNIDDIIDPKGDVQSVIKDFGRGGDATGDHVNMLGNVRVLSDILKEVTSPTHSSLEDQIVTNIVSMSEKLSSSFVKEEKRERNE